MIAEGKDKDKLSSSGHGQAGPLSSHPVTPIETANGNPEGVLGAFPFTNQDLTRSNTNSTAMGKQGGNSRASATGANGIHHANGIHPTGNDSSSSPLSHHRHNASAMPSSSDTQQSSSKSSPSNARRRPSFAERFLRLRSLSNIRNSWNGSRASLSGSNQYQQDSSSRAQTPLGDPSLRASGEMLSGPHSVAYARGMKRPASPSVEGSSVYSSANDGRPSKERAGSQTFPRMMRKKSMEWLGSARRMSGMFGRDTPGPTHQRNMPGSEYPDNDYAMEEEERRERMREELERDQSVEYRRTTETTREPPREPPPTIPETEHIIELDGDEMFKNIGR